MGEGPVTNPWEQNWSDVPASRPWEQNWNAPQQPAAPIDNTSDIIKSAAVGPLKGAISVAGAIPDIASAVKGAANQYLFDPLFNAISGPPKAAPEAPDINKMFGSENLTKAASKSIESLTGKPLYEPKGEYGRYAQSATEAIPAALIGPGGMIGKAAMGLASGLGAEGLGSQYHGTPLEPYARMIGGVLGGGAGIVGGKGIETVRNINAANKTGEAIGNILGTDPIKGGAVNRVAGSLAEDKITPEIAAAKQAALGPKDTMVLDLGRQMQGRAEAIAQHPGEAQNTVLNAVEGRTGEFGSGARSRIADTLDQHLGPSRNVVHVMDDVDNIVKQYATPAYEKVMSDFPVINVPSEITSRPAVAQAMKNAEGLAKNYGEKLGTQETRTILAGDGYHIAEDVNLPAKTSLKYWDYVKKGMDQRINGMMRHGMDDLSSAEKADLGGLLNAKQSLVNYLDGVTGGQYESARRIAATKPELHEAMDFGRAIFNSKLLPEEVHAHISDLSIPAQGMVQVGARRELERVLDAARNDGAKARSFLDTNNNLQKIRSLFGDQAATAIENRVAAENTFQNATQDIAKNSRTSVRQQLRADTETPAPARIDTTLTGLALKPFKAGYAYALEHGMANTRTGISQILTAKEQQLLPIVEQLLGYNAKRASNSAAPVSQQAGALIRALIASRQGGSAPQ
jgi:hypothetical protein